MMISVHTDGLCFQLTIEACDNGIPQRCLQDEMRIVVVRDHFPPVPTLDPFTATIYENHTIGAFVLQLQATDNTQLVSHTLHHYI